MAAETSPHPGRYRLIAHLRGAAALAVTLFHSFGAEEGRPIWAPLQPLRALADHGWLGVHVFFVISGYCIADKVSSLSGRPGAERAFLLDRFWRIMPPYWAALLLVVLVGLASAPFNRSGLGGALPSDPRAALAELLLVHPYLGVGGILLVGWTLVCETGYYLAAAALLAGWRAGLGGGGAFLLSLALTVLCALPSVAGVAAVFTYWPEFWLGMLAYAAIATRRAAPGALVILAFAALVAWHPGGGLSGVHQLACLTALILVVLHRWDALLSAMPGLRWLGAIGLWSYSLYLVHAPLLSRLHNLGSRLTPAQAPAYALVWLLSLSTALSGAWLFYRTVEAPLESWRRSRRGLPPSR